MSGAEAIILLGVLGNTLQLIDFSCKALARIKECREDTAHLPKVFWNLQNQLPLISHVLEITNKQTQSHEFDEHACKALLPVIHACQNDITRLKAILEKVAPSTSDTAWKRNLKAVTSVFHDKEVGVIAASLSQSLGAINQHHAAYTASTTGTILRKLTAAVEATPDKNQNEGASSIVHFMVPLVWSDEFTGRTETMELLETLMSDNRKHRRVAIIGLGGIGKTRIILQYAYRFKNLDTHSVFWLHASSMSRVNRTCLEIAKNAKISGWEDPKSNKLELVKEWLESPRSGKWILLVDNADDFDLLFGSGHLVKSLPRSDDGAILMTTRNARIGMEFAKLTTISLGALTPEESIELLDTRLGAGDNENDNLAELSQELCGIPLALVQASSFIRQNFLSIPNYLELYRASDIGKIELLSEDFDDVIRDSESQNAVATTWSVSFDHIRHWDPLAAEILSVMSMLDAQAIPESLVRFGDSNLKFSKAMGTLQAFSLIAARADGPIWNGRREKSFDLHRLVRVAMRSWLSYHGELESYTARALATMAERFTDSEWETRGKWSSYLPHAAVLLASDQLVQLEDLVLAPVSHDQESGILNHDPEGILCPICAASLLAILSTCYYTIGKPIISLEEAEKAYRLRKKYLGENHLDTLATLDLIAKPAKDLYLFPKAVLACELAIKGKSESLGPDHPSTLRSMAYLGMTLRPMGKLQESKEIGMRALKTRRKVLGNTHLDTLISMNYIATVTRALGDYETAVELETEKLQSWTELQGPSHPQSLEAMAGLAWAHACQGHYDQAAQLMSHSLNLQLEIQGPGYFFTLWTMSNMAVILGMQGKYPEAEELGERVLSLRTHYMGLSHPFRYVSKLYLAWLYNETERYQEAETVELEVLDFQQQFYASDTHHDVLLTKSQLASTYAFMGRHDDAEHIKTKVLEIRMRLTGKEHPATLRCKSSLGMTLMELQKLPEANELLTGAYASQRRILGDEHPETITTMSRIAKLYERQAWMKEAEGLYQDTFRTSIKALGQEHPRTAARAKDLTRFQLSRGSSESAANVLPAKFGVTHTNLMKGLNDEMQKLTVLEETGKEKQRE